MNATTKRLLAYPLSLGIIAALGWLAFGYRAEADYGTLLSSASIHAELAAAIPADSTKSGILELRARLIRESYEWLARADRVEADTVDAAQLRAFLAMTEGRPGDAAELYRACRSRADVDAEFLAPLALHEAKALSNAGDFEGALTVLESKVGSPTPLQTTEREALRVRVLHRLGRESQAISAAEAMITAGGEGDVACRMAAELLESMGAYGPAEAGWNKAETDQEVRSYHLGRLKVRAGDKSEADRLLVSALHDRDAEVIRRLENDRRLWSEVVGEERVSELLASTGEASAGPGR
ncbi:MAG: hypothetical protein AB7I19_08090 [Planctomycetota bacterium]